jgi:DUF4097 and DUF4098 domain-containing protein YvlB
MKTKVTICCVVSALLGSLIIPAYAASDFERNIDKTFQVNPGGRFTIDADRGSIKIASDATNQVQVRVIRKVQGGTASQADEVFARHEVTMTQNGNAVTVVGKMASERLFTRIFRGSDLEVHYEVSIPQKCEVDLKTSGGNIEMTDLDGSAVTRTSSGSIKLGKIAGQIEAADSGGDISIGESGGNVVARTSSGSIRIGTVNGKSVTAKNSGGSIEIGNVEGDVIAETSSGSIRINRVKGGLKAKDSGGDIVIGDIGGTAAMQTSSGSIKLKSVNGKSDAKNSGGSITIGQAGGESVIRTSSGSIQIGIAKGKLQADNSGGKIEVAEARDVVLARTSSGHIAVSFSTTPKAPCRLEVSGGGINVALPKSAAVNLDAKASGGKVVSELAVTARGSSDKQAGVLQGTLNGGGPAIILRTSSGDINLKQATPIAAESPEK